MSPDPSAPGRGRLKVFIGMAAGVGKTYRMLQEGRSEAVNGRDVAIGYLEPHGRLETESQAEGLERVPTRGVLYRGTPLQEMDLPAVLARAPELCLIDELAHTNAPGTEHEKRYEDVEDVLAAGIDVFSTVNVQHLESLNDQVMRLTGTRVRETIPDDVLSAADEVVLVDLTPEALIERLRAGKVYPRERVGAALNNFFKVENLSALRETALRQVAQDVEVRRLVRPQTPAIVRREDEEERLLSGEPAGAGQPQAITEKLLALVALVPDAQRIVRRAWRSAERLGAKLDILVVRPPGRPPSSEDREQLEALRRLASVLGTRLIVEEAEDVAAVAIETAESLGTTYLLMGAPPERRGLRRMSESLLDRLLRELPGVDVRIVTDPTLRRGRLEGAGDLEDAASSGEDGPSSGRTGREARRTGRGAREDE